MTLSCNAWDIFSALPFEPDVECNLLNARLNPALDILNPLIEKKGTCEYVLSKFELG